MAKHRIFLIIALPIVAVFGLLFNVYPIFIFIFSAWLYNCIMWLFFDEREISLSRLIDLFDEIAQKSKMGWQYIQQARDYLKKMQDAFRTAEKILELNYCVKHSITSIHEVLQSGERAMIIHGRRIYNRIAICNQRQKLSKDDQVFLEKELQKMEETIEKVIELLQTTSELNNSDDSQYNRQIEDFNKSLKLLIK